MELIGQSFVGGGRGARNGEPFWAINPATGEKLEPAYATASPAEVERAVELAEEAFPIYANASGRAKGTLLRGIADGIDGIAQEIAERAHLETALPMARLLGEVARTTSQLRLFAEVVEEGSWVEARIDTARPDRKPLPRPELRSMLRPLGPVAVFGASNFPVAFSAAGGDTASALAAGCPVVAKAHPAHPGTSELVAGAIERAVAAAGMPQGVYSLVYGAGNETGAALVRHPLIRAVAFTGSIRGGRALMDIAAARPEPIPCFTEMSSGNPVFVLPGALKERAGAIAEGLFGSFTLGAGQFCTKPGIVFLPEGDEAAGLAARLGAMVSGAAPFTLLTPGIAREYARAAGARAAQATQVARAQAATVSCGANAQLFRVTLEEFLGERGLAEEIFGPDTLLVECPTSASFKRAAESLEGHLTATVLGTDEDLAAHGELIALLERKAGRLIFNGYPTGVEVCHAMVHGGPYPATSDARFTSVGTRAIYRFARPVCYQGFPDAAMPAELKAENGLGILRMVDGVYTRDALGA